jgi:membrane protein required for colicin V production
MNWLDITIAIPLCVALFKGFQKGFIVSVFSLIGIFIGIYSAVHFSFVIAPKLQNAFEIRDNWIELVAFCTMLFGVYIAVWLIAKVIEKLVDLASLGFVNKLGGAIFNFLKATLFIGAILIALNSVALFSSIISIDTKNNSLFYQPISKISSFLIPALSSSKLFQPIIDLKKDVKDKI